MYEKINEMVWVTEDGRKIRLDQMSRTHIQNCLRWCQTKLDKSGRPAGQIKKDGFTYQDWLSAFFAKLMDPKLD